MRRKSGTRAAARFVRSKSKAKRRDATIDEFETRDLGDDIASAGAATVVHPQRPAGLRRDRAQASRSLRPIDHG
jgi:hypothetical protein